MEKKKNGGKRYLKDLCREDKAKVGELIEKIAQEKKDKIGLKNENSELREMVERLKEEKRQILMEKERALVKLDKCMELLKDLQGKPGPEMVDMYSQTVRIEEYKESLGLDMAASVFDDKFFSLVKEIENEDERLTDSRLIKIIEDLEFTY